MAYSKYPSWEHRILDFVRDHVGLYLRRDGSEKKPLATQLADMYRLFRYYRHPPHHYLTYELYRRDLGSDVCDFVPPPLLRRFIHRINPPDAAANVEDKKRFARLMQHAGVPSVPVLASVERDGAILDPDDRPLGFPGLLARLRAARRTRVFLKPTFGSEGVGHHVAEIRGDVLQIEGRGADESLLRSILFGDGRFASYLVQPVIEQHELLARLNPAAINTVRIDTFVDGNRIHTNGAVLRIGSGERHTDNWAAGGYLARIDPGSGVVSATATTKAKYGRRTVRAHPKTGFVFGGVVLPYWSEVRALVADAARAVQPLRYVGWDVAIAPDGPLVIEGNHPSDVSMLQYGVGGLRNTPLGRATIALFRPERVSS